MKRVFSVLMICALLLAGLTSFAGAEGTPALAITVDQASVQKGDTVTAKVTALDYTGEAWSAMTVKVTYDPTYLSFDENTGVLSNAALEEIQTVVADVKDGVGTILINWISSDGVPAADYLVQLQFTALAETTNAVISAEFTADGQALIGSSDPIVNTDDSAFSSAVVESAPIEVQPEATDPTEATVTTTKAPDNTASIKVKSEYAQGKRIDSYKVIISWEDMTYTYADGLEWNPGEHQWELAGTGEGWGTIDAKDITITNHSNKSVTATASYEATVEGTDFTWSTESVTVDGAEGYTVEEPPTGIISATFVPGTAVITDLENPNPMGIIKITIE
ncbi:MAG: hypothetical protein IJO92_01735 [Clostridia bacterium]|nr:hypothetical protein [Clostridia bacterium]